MSKKIGMLVVVCLVGLVGVCVQAQAADMALLNQLKAQQAQAEAHTQALVQSVQPTLTQGLGTTDSAGAYNPTYVAPAAVNPAKTSCESMGDNWNSSVSVQ